MKAWHILTATMILAAPAMAAAQYEPLANPPDPVAQRNELIALYDEICLRAFPDDSAAAAAAARHDGMPLSRRDIQRFLHDDPGIGWQVRGRTGRFDVTIEQSPPYHACAVRTMTANGFADLGPYQALATRYEQSGRFERIAPMDFDAADFHVTGGGERLVGPGQRTESLLIIMTRAPDAARAHGQTAIEVRFAHQYVGGQDEAAKPGS
jgi:hypothetical protein